jgi:hypothetical protein
MDRKKPSLDATIKVGESIRNYLDAFRERGDSLFIGPIRVVTSMEPHILVPVNMDPNEMRHHLEHTRYMLSEAIEWARKSAHLTREAIEELITSSVEAEQRIKSMEEIANELEAVLNSFRGIAWHPECYIEIKRLYQDRFARGDPAIRILVEVLV